MTPTIFRVLDKVRHVVWRAIGPRTVGVRALVVDGDGRVLLVRHTYGKAQWHLPGGGVHRRESLVAALHRELHEETGFVVTGPVRLLGTYAGLAGGRSDYISVFVVDRFEPAPTDTTDRKRSAEIAEVSFFFIDALPDAASPATRRRVDDYTREGELRSFDW